MKQKFFNLAEKLAKKSDHPEQKHGAVIVQRGSVEGIGFNSNKTNPKAPGKFKTRHAEFNAVLNSGLENLANCEIYIFRRKKNGSLGNSRPCNSCEGMLRELGIKTVFYSVEDGYKKESYG